MLRPPAVLLEAPGNTACRCPGIGCRNVRRRLVGAPSIDLIGKAARPKLRQPTSSTGLITISCQQRSPQVDQLIH